MAAAVRRFVIEWIVPSVIIAVAALLAARWVNRDPGPPSEATYAFDELLVAPETLGPGTMLTRDAWIIDLATATPGEVAALEARGAQAAPLRDAGVRAIGIVTYRLADGREAAVILQGFRTIDAAGAFWRGLPGATPAQDVIERPQAFDFQVGPLVVHVGTSPSGGDLARTLGTALLGRARTVIPAEGP